MDYDMASIGQIHNDLGRRLNAYRISREIKHQALAREAGVSRATLTRFLNGQGGSFDTFLRILRALDLVQGLPAIIPDAEASPLAKLKRSKSTKMRKRVRSNKADVGPVSWTWGETDSDETDPE